MDERKPVVVQSAEGQSRAVIVLLAHKMVSEGLPLSEAFAQIIAQRPQAMPNPTFMKALMLLDTKLGRLTAGAQRRDALFKFLDAFPHDVENGVDDETLERRVPGYL